MWFWDLVIYVLRCQNFFDPNSKNYLKINVGLAARDDTVGARALEPHLPLSSRAARPSGRGQASYQRQEMSRSGVLRCRRVDPLAEALSCLDSDDLTKLKEVLSRDPILKAFQKRIREPKIAMGRSPLVLSVLKDSKKIFFHIMENMKPNLEQETSVVIDNGYPVESATPLWTASTLGKLQFVQRLVDRGADIEHTTESGSSPLRGSAFDGHCDVCELLIGMGADIDKPNQVGQSPLTIAAAMNKTDCVKLLIKKGADVNHKGHNGDTPLHVCVESGSVEIAKILVEAGAKNVPNDVGFTHTILACCYGHVAVMKYLVKKFGQGLREEYDCYCLLASKEILGGQLGKTSEWLHKAVKLRQKHPKEFNNIPAASSVYEGIEEPKTEEEVHHILQDETRMFYLSSIFCERILGKVHPTTAFYIRISGDLALGEKRYAKSFELWQRSLQFDNATRMAYELQIIEDLIFSIRGFSVMIKEGFFPQIAKHFQWGVKEYQMAHDSKISDLDVMACLFRMLAVWIKMADKASDPERKDNEREQIECAIQQVIELIDEKPYAVIIACMQNLPADKSGTVFEITKHQLPLHKVLALLLDHGCPIVCEDADGNCPLHLAVQLKDDSALDCVKTLVDYGCHVDAVNYDGLTALDLARKCSDRDEIVRELEMGRFISLQCLASHAVIDHALPYANTLPEYLCTYISWHKVDALPSL